MVFEPRFPAQIPEKMPAHVPGDTCLSGKNQAMRQDQPEESRGEQQCRTENRGDPRCMEFCPVYRTGSIPCDRGVGELEP